MSAGAVLEANFVRLLQCTESLSTSENLNYYEFSVYYQKLQELLYSLTKSKLRPAAEFLHIYKSRVEQLSAIKDKCQPSDHKETSDGKSEFENNMQKWLRFDHELIDRRNQRRKALFFPLDPSESIKWLDQDDKPPSTKENVEGHLAQNNKSKSPPTRYLADVPNSYARLRNLANQEARRNLGLDDDNKDQSNVKASGMLDVEVLERDKIAEGMLSLTEELKLTQMAIGDRIRADISVLSASSATAQVNEESLASVSRRVREELGNKFGLFIWILFLVTLVVFFWMVFFIKFTPKGLR
ncbi:hypothetical protein Aperf_G00000044602 [Anoplocephala perfoliata]